MIESVKNQEDQKDLITNQNNSEKKSTKKIKKSKKAKKKKPQKECKNLKELLEEIKQEKEQKLLKEKKLKEKKKEKEENKLKDNLNFINRSTSCATTGTSSLDDFNLPNYLLINNNDISENVISDENVNKKRKMSSPIFDYYNGCDKYLSTEKEGSIDLTNSANFIEKNKFISSYELNSNPKNINPNLNEVIEKNNNENKFNSNENINIENIEYNSNVVYNNENEYLAYYNYIPDSKFSVPEYNNDIQNIIKNINNHFATYYSNMYVVDKNQKNNSSNKKYEKKNKSKMMNKSNTVRIGDWTCMYCYNLNFSFRKSCNRCNAPKPIF